MRADKDLDLTSIELTSSEQDILDELLTEYPQVSRSCIHDLLAQGEQFAGAWLYLGRQSHRKCCPTAEVARRGRELRSALDRGHLTPLGAAMALLYLVGATISDGPNAQAIAARATRAQNPPTIEPGSPSPDAP